MSAAASVQEAAVDGAPVADAPAPSPSVEIEVKPEPAKFGGPGALRAEVARLTLLAADVPALRALVEEQGKAIAELQAQLARLAASMGRSDILTPPATVEQLRAAHKRGAQLLVLRDLAITGSAGIKFVAGTKVEARQYPLDRLIELLETGRLSVAVVV
jgi:hypothetical protein